MSKETIQTDYKYIKTVLIPFIRENGERRISNELLEHYARFFIHRPKMDKVIIAESCENDRIMAISIATIRNDSNVTYSTTITHKTCRKLGYGTKALKAKITRLKELGMGIKTTVADDNEGGMKLCSKVGLKPFERRERMRSTGKYTAVTWVDPPKAVEED